MAQKAERTRRMFIYELWRAGTAGILETAGTTFLLLIAVSWFQAGSLAKALVAASGSLGLLLSPLAVASISSLGWRSGRAASAILALGALSFVLAAALPHLLVFVAGCVLAMTTSSVIIPLLTQMYHENYPASGRGRLFSRTVMVRIATAAVFAKVAGDALTGHLQGFPWLLLVFAAALGLASFCLYRCPSRPIESDGGIRPLRAMRFARQDRLFRRVLVSWMLLGFANLMMLPLRVEYLANPKYGLALTAAKVALLTAVIPNLARLLCSPLWGYLFDHMNFFLLRSTLNLAFAGGILLFFLSQSLPGFVAGALVYGVANAGGEVAWSLWVTKFAPPARVADYMSVHTFLTGVRGVLAPACAFFLANTLPLPLMAILCSVLIFIATGWLMPEIWRASPSRNGDAIVEEISD